MNTPLNPLTYALVYEELYHEGAKEIIGAFSRINYKFPKHPDAKKWDEEATTWFNYHRNIVSTLNFTTEEDADVELKRIERRKKELLQLEIELAKV